jgi:hypothetical protein
VFLYQELKQSKPFFRHNNKFATTPRQNTQVVDRRQKKKKIKGARIKGKKIIEETRSFI